MQIFIPIYFVVASFLGWKFMTNRIRFLEQKKPLNLILKLIVSVATGQIIGVFYVIYLLFKVMSKM